VFCHFPDFECSKLNTISGTAQAIEETSGISGIA